MLPEVPCISTTSAQPGTFNETVEWYEGKGFWFDYPTVKCTDGKWTIQSPDALSGALPRRREFASLGEVFDLERRCQSKDLETFERYIIGTLKSLREQARKFGALIIEPVVLGAGGMSLV